MNTKIELFKLVVIRARGIIAEATPNMNKVLNFKMVVK